MNYFDYSIVSNEVWHHIFNFIEDERTLGKIPRVCHQWRIVAYDPLFKAWIRPYQLIWQEMPLFGPGKPFESPLQAFQDRFTFTRLHQVGRALGGVISSVADNILAIRRSPVQEDHPVTPFEQYHSLQFWHQKFCQAYLAKDLLRQMYAGKEVCLLFQAKDQSRELFELRMECLDQVIDPDPSEKQKLYSYAMFEALFYNPEEFKAFILQYEEPFDLLYNSAKHGFNDVIRVYLEANSEVMNHEAPLFLAEAAENQQFETMQLMLAHRPALPCCPVNGLPQETGLHNLCTLSEMEVWECEFATWQTLAQELISRGCHPFYRDERGLTSFHRAIQKTNSKCLNWLMEQSTPSSPAFFQELRRYFFDDLDSQSGRSTTDEDYEDEIQILRTLFAHHPSLRNGFDLTHDFCWYPWILPVLIESTDPQTEQHNFQLLFTHLLATPDFFIQDLLNNYTARDYVFLQSEVASFLETFERQIHRLMTAGLFLDYINSEGQTPIHLLILSLRTIEITLNEKLKNKAVIRKLFSKCQMTYQGIIQKMITKENFQNLSSLINQFIDLAEEYKYDELQAMLLLLALNLNQLDLRKPPKKHPRIH
jgi:hypothetical protein